MIANSRAQTATALMLLFLLGPGDHATSSDFEEYEKAQQEAREQFEKQQKQAFEHFYKEQKQAFEAFSQAEDGVVNRINPYQEKDILPAKPLTIPSKPISAPSPPPERDQDMPSPQPSKQVPEEKSALEVKEEPRSPPEVKESPPTMEEASEIAGGVLRLNYFGTSILVRDIGSAKLEGRFEDVDPSAIAGEAKRRNAWLVPELQRIRQEYTLNDWDTVVLVRLLMNTLYDPSQIKIKTVQAIDLLRALGYRCRLGRADQTPVVLLAIRQDVFYKSFLTVEGEKYYLFRMDRHARMNPEGSVYLSTSPEDDVGAPVDMSMNRMQRLGMRAQHRVLTWDFKGKPYSIDVQFNGGLLDLMDEYPQTDLSVYFRSGTHRGPWMDLVRQLKALLDQEAFTQEEQVNFLLRLVQKAFPYKTDQDAYGYERPLFVEQSLGLPYLDCEDRSILLSTLYRNVLGWDTIGLDYPMHVALGVHVPVPLKGDAYMYNSQRYLVADPTYFYVNAGTAQPKYRDVSAHVIEAE